MKKALSKLWDLYAETKAGRVNDSLDYCEKKFKYLDEIEKLQKTGGILRMSLKRLLRRSKCY
jgi:hypothetical protein